MNYSEARALAQAAYAKQLKAAELKRDQELEMETRTGADAAKWLLSTGIQEALTVPNGTAKYWDMRLSCIGGSKDIGLRLALVFRQQHGGVSAAVQTALQEAGFPPFRMAVRVSGDRHVLYISLVDPEV